MSGSSEATKKLFIIVIIIVLLLVSLCRIGVYWIVTKSICVMKRNVNCVC